MPTAPPSSRPLETTAALDKLQSTAHLMLCELVRPHKLPLQELCSHDQAVSINAAGCDVRA